MFAFFDPMYLLFLAPGLLLSLWAQFKVKSAYANAQRVRAASGLSGAETARAMLDAHNLHNVGVEMVQGHLSDHYDPRAKVLRLSPGVYQGRSVASAGIAAHEAGHAIQDATNYPFLIVRNGIVPLASVGSNLSWILIFIGFLMGAAGTMLGSWLIFAGIALFAVVVVFQIVNLPVEFDASKRAKDLLQSTGLVAQGEQASAMNKVLNAAALTYVAATLTAVLTLLYFLMRSGLLGGRGE